MSDPTLYVWEKSKQKSTALLALLAVAEFADPVSGEASPTIPELARRLRMTDRNAQALLRRLEEAGEIRTVDQGGRPTGTGNANRYVLLGYKEWRQALINLPDTNPQAVQLSDELEYEGVKDSVPAVHDFASLEKQGMQVPVVTPLLRGETSRAPAVQLPVIASLQEVQHSAIEGGAAQNGTAESLESLDTDSLDIKDSLKDSQDSAKLPPTVLESARAHFALLDERGMDSLAQSMKRFGADSVIACMEYGAVQKSKPQHPRWLYPVLERFAAQGITTPEQIRALIPKPDASKDQKPDYLGGKFASFISNNWSAEEEAEAAALRREYAARRDGVNQGDMTTR